MDKARQTTLGDEVDAIRKVTEVTADLSASESERVFGFVLARKREQDVTRIVSGAISQLLHKVEGCTCPLCEAERSAARSAPN